MWRSSVAVDLIAALHILLWLARSASPDKSYISNGRSHIQAVAADDFSVLFHHHAAERWVRNHGREYMRGNLRGWEIVRDIVLVRERCESVKADSSAHLRVGWNGAANDKSLLSSIHVSGCATMMIAASHTLRSKIEI
jgi:hypothetical protein